MPFSFVYVLWGVYSNIMFIAFLEPSPFRFSCISRISRMTGNSRSSLCVSYSLPHLYDEESLINQKVGWLMYGSPFWHCESWLFFCIVGRLISLVHLVFATHCVYFYVITSFGNIGAVNNIVWCVVGHPSSEPHSSQMDLLHKGLSRCKQFWMYVHCRSMWSKFFHCSDGFKIIHRS